MLDLRVPTGFFFTIVGLILVGMGVFCRRERAALTERNVNLYCGLVMLAFGVLHAGAGTLARTRRLMIAAFREALRRAPTSSRLPRARPRQPDRRAHRLQPGLRPARGAGPGHATSPPRPIGDGKLRIYSENRGETARVRRRRRSRTLQPAHDWTDYVDGRGAGTGARRLPDRRRANLLIRSTVPDGSGLSSSAALEVSTALALLGGPRVRPAGTGEAVPARRAQFRRHALRHHGPVHLGLRARARGGRDRLPQPGTPSWCRCPTASTFVAVNTMVKHELSGSAYRDRVQECAAAVEGIQAALPGRGEPARRHAGACSSSVADRLPEWWRGARATW